MELLNPSLSAGHIVPGPKDIQFEEVVHGLRNDPDKFVANLIRTYGDIVELPFGSRKVFLLGDPNFIRQIFTGGPFAKRKDLAAEMEYLNGISTFSSYFEPTAISAFGPSMMGAAERASFRWEKRWAESGAFEVDIYREIGRITLEVVAETLFGSDIQEEAEAIFEAILRMDHGYGFDPIEATLGVLMPPPDIQPSSESQAARESIRRFVERIAKSQEGRCSFLSRVIGFMGMEKAVQVGLTAMLAMHEVTATTMSWTFLALAKNPELDARLSSELSQVLHGRRPRPEDAQALSYTRMLLAEGRRLYPSVWIMGRFLRDDVTFGDYRVPAESVVMASQLITHRDSRFFPDPDVFDPLRWTAEAVSKRPEFSYFPFSAGPRACAGEAFAELQDVLMLTTLAQDWQGQPVAGDAPKSIPKKSSAPRPGIRMSLRRRGA